MHADLKRRRKDKKPWLQIVADLPLLDQLYDNNTQLHSRKALNIPLCWPHMSSVSLHFCSKDTCKLYDVRRVGILGALRGFAREREIKKEWSKSVRQRFSNADS